jgi:hypothetical protein
MVVTGNYGLLIFLVVVVKIHGDEAPPQPIRKFINQIIWKQVRRYQRSDSKNRKCDCQKKKRQIDKKKCGRQRTTQKTNDIVAWTPLKLEVNPRALESVSRSCSIRATHRVTLLNNAIISNRRHFYQLLLGFFWTTAWLYFCLRCFADNWA